MKLTKHSSFDMKATSGFAGTSEGNIILRRQEKIIITGRDINILEQYSVCDCQPGFFYSFTACEFFPDTDDGKYIADLCRECGNVSVVNCNTRERYIGMKLPPGKYSSLCRGPKGTLLIGGYKIDNVLQLIWKNTDKALQESKRYQFTGTCFMTNLWERDDEILISENKRVTALKLDPDRAIVTELWGSSGSFDGIQLLPYGVTSDSEGRVYIADSTNCRIHIVDGRRGVTIQTVPLDKKLGSVFDVFWLPNPPQLLVKYYSVPGASIYNIENEQAQSVMVYSQ